MCEGKEPEHFFMIFKRRLLIYHVSITVSHGKTLHSREKCFPAKFDIGIQNTIFSFNFRPDGIMFFMDYNLKNSRNEKSPWHKKVSFFRKVEFSENLEDAVSIEDMENVAVSISGVL